MSSKDAHLYGTKPKSRSQTKHISSSSSLAFSSTLSSLIKSSSSGERPARAHRPAKDDIFKTHNKNVKKRALKDLEDAEIDATVQKHRTRTTAETAEDDATWRRTKRRMEEKARLYNALKRGDIEDIDDKYGVDFDRKWADAQEEAAAGEASESSSDDDDDEDQVLVEYLDEFGRTRKGTRAEAAREELRQRSRAADEPDRFTARPVMPDNIIYGDTVQVDAFNPDATITEQMAELAAKRDRSLTPPPDLHFDGRSEARQRGTGFMYFSKDEEERKEQMDRLQKDREDTERMRRERKEAVEKRRELVKEKRKVLAEKRGRGKADQFLDQLGVELFDSKDGSGGTGGGSAEKEDEEKAD